MSKKACENFSWELKNSHEYVIFSWESHENSKTHKNFFKGGPHHISRRSPEGNFVCHLYRLPQITPTKGNYARKV